MTEAECRAADQQQLDNIASARQYCSVFRAKDRDFQQQCNSECGVSLSTVYDGSVIRCVAQHDEYKRALDEAAAVHRNGIIATCGGSSISRNPGMGRSEGLEEVFSVRRLKTGE